MDDIPFRILLLGVVFIVSPVVVSVRGELTACEIEKMLKPLLEDHSIQAQALRHRLASLLRQNQLETIDNALEAKRSLSSLAQWNNLPSKRSLEALARAGYLKPTPEEDPQEDPDSLKRSIQNLARNGQLPHSADEEKRSIASLARNGELSSRKEFADLLEDLYDKRNIGSLARDFNLPNYGKRFWNYPISKRNVAALARDGVRFGGKRNVAALLRQDNYMRSHDRSPEDRTDDDEDLDAAKRHIGSLKSQSRYKRAIPYADIARAKRDADYYDDDVQPGYQNENYNSDYEDLLRSLSDYPEVDKRFLGSLARSGWPSSLSRYRVEKRHIGSLARLGWLPAFRSVRRFNRSGRSSSDCCREAAANGQTEDDHFTEGPIPLDDKRFLLIPTVDNVLLSSKFPMRPRTH